MFYFKKIKWAEALLFIIALALVALPILYQNQNIYGHPLSSGYSQLESSGDASSLSSTSFLNYIFPFGIHPYDAWDNFYNYYVWLLWWFFIPIILGGLLFVLKIFRRPKKQLAYFVICLLVSLFLVIYYGSWVFHDNPDPDQITIGTSYIRYWLPMYLLSLPYIGLLFSKLLKKKKIGGIILALIFLIMVFFSVKLTVYGPQEGILKVKENIYRYENIAKEVFNLTEENSIIIASRSDKMFFPERRVIFEAKENKDLESIYKLLEQDVPVYYFNFTFPQKDWDYLNNRRFAEFGFNISEPIKTFDELSLYKLNKL